MKKKKKLILVIQLIFVGILLLIYTGCDKEDYSLPELSTLQVTEITQTTAESGGNITNDGNSEITVRGVCWSTSTGPTVDDDITTNGIGKGTFTSNLTNLEEGTTYYIRAYAFNMDEGVSYGNEITFETAQP